MSQASKDKAALKRYQETLKRIKLSGSTNPFETKQDQMARIAKAKNDVKFMVEYYFPHYATSECADFHLDFAKQVMKNKTYKGFAQWGRGLAKSVWVDILLPFWLWMNEETHYLVIVGNNYDKAKTLLSDLQAEFEANPRIINDFGEQKVLGSWEDGNFRTKSGFIGKALGMGQSVRGLRVQAQRPDLCVCDDLEDKGLIKNPRRQDEFAAWIERDLIPTMDGDIRRFIQANNRFAPRMIQTVLQERHPKWKVHQVNAYDPTTYIPAWHTKYDNNYYKELEDEIGTLAAKAEFNNEPHVEGKIFTDEQIQWCKLPRITSFECIVGHWDIAYAGNSTSDFNAIKLWGLKDGKFYLIDCYLKQSKMRQAIEWIADFQKKLTTNAIIHWRYESQFWNDEVDRTIRDVEVSFQTELKLVKVDTPRTKKYDRMLTMQPYYQNSRIYYGEKLKSHNDTLEGIAQLKGIEPGYKGHDDSPDSDQQAIDFLSKHIYIKSSSKILTGKYEKRNSW